MGEPHDAGEDRETRTRPCCVRIEGLDLEGDAGITWCGLPEGHDGPHLGAQLKPIRPRTNFGPRSKK